MKVRHMRTVVSHDPGFVLRYGRRMFAHTFRGSTWKSAVGLESTREAFRRYQAIRRREREYMDWPDPPASTVGQVPPEAGAREGGPVAVMTKLFVDIDELIRQ